MFVIVSGGRAERVSAEVSDYLKRGFVISGHLQVTLGASTHDRPKYHQALIKT